VAAKALSTCPQLHKVDLSLCYELTDEAVRALATCPLLQVIRVSECYGVTDACVGALLKCQHLKEVDVFHTLVTDAAATKLSQMNGGKIIVDCSWCFYKNGIKHPPTPW
jgi:hypothetical protein